MGNSRLYKRAQTARIWTDIFIKRSSSSVELFLPLRVIVYSSMQVEMSGNQFIDCQQLRAARVEEIYCSLSFVIILVVQSTE